MAEQEERIVNAKRLVVTPEALRAAAADAEIRGDWLEAQLLVSASDRIIQIEAQNQAYRHALANGVSINLISKRRWFRLWRD